MASIRLTGPIPKTKVCRTCEAEKSFYDFAPNSTRSDGRMADCQDCRKGHVVGPPSKQRQKSDPQSVERYEKWKRSGAPQRERAAQMKKNYGLTMREYDAILVAQHGVCAICGTGPSTRDLDVDHDHATGKVRGLLCNPCNAGLGMFRDNPATLQSAILYLALHSEP